MLREERCLLPPCSLKLLPTQCQDQPETFQTGGLLLQLWECKNSFVHGTSWNCHYSSVWKGKQGRGASQAPSSPKHYTLHWVWRPSGSPAQAGADFNPENHKKHTSSFQEDAPVIPGPVIPSSEGTCSFRTVKSPCERLCLSRQPGNNVNGPLVPRPFPRQAQSPLYNPPSAGTPRASPSPPPPQLDSTAASTPSSTHPSQGRSCL